MNNPKPNIKFHLEKYFGVKGLKFYVYLEENKFFTERASTKYHGNYEGGLFDHCKNLHNKLFEEPLISFKESFTEPLISFKESFVIAYLHDLCKLGAYTKAGTYNKNHPKGHAKLSLEIIDKFIDLTDFERKAIKFHMGIYGTKEFSPNGEYRLSELLDAWKDPKVKLIHWCDDYVSQFVDVKK